MSTHNYMLFTDSGVLDMEMSAPRYYTHLPTETMAQWIADAVVAETAQAAVDTALLSRALYLLAAKHGWSTLDLVAAGAAASAATTTQDALAAVVSGGGNGTANTNTNTNDRACTTRLLSRVQARVEKRLLLLHV